MFARFFIMRGRVAPASTHHFTETWGCLRETQRGSDEENALLEAEASYLRWAERMFATRVAVIPKRRAVTVRAISSTRRGWTR